MNRLVLILLCGLVLLALPRTAFAAGPPNVLVIVTDDQRTGSTTVMPKTQRWFGTHGRSYRNAFVTTPLCCPSRASIFTGLYAHNHGITNNGSGGLPQEATVQRYLTDAGYATGMIGKFLNTWRVSRNPPYFNRWALTGTEAAYFNPIVNLDGTVQQVPGYTTSFARRKAVSFLRSFETANDAQPWFLYVSTRAPHAPATPAARYEDAPVPPWSMNPAVRETDLSDKPPWVRAGGRSQDWVRSFRAQQLRTLMSVDELVDEVFRELGALGERRDTLAVFLSDNGFMWGEHGLASKRYPYTDSVKVPLLMRWPGHIAAGSMDSRFALNVDIAPTILAAAGVAPLTPMDGRDLLADWSRPHLFTEYWTDIDHSDIPSWDSIRTRRAHYIRHYNADRSRVVFREYYRLRSDPWELQNVLRDGIPTNNPSTDRLDRLIKRYRSCAGATCP